MGKGGVALIMGLNIHGIEHNAALMEARLACTIKSAYNGDLELDKAY